MRSIVFGIDEEVGEKECPEILVGIPLCVGGHELPMTDWL